MFKAVALVNLSFCHEERPEASFAMPRAVAIDNLFAFSLLSFAGGIAGVASGLPLGFEGGFTR